MNTSTAATSSENTTEARNSINSIDFNSIRADIHNLRVSGKLNLFYYTDFQNSPIMAFKDDQIQNISNLTTLPKYIYKILFINVEQGGQIAFSKFYSPKVIYITDLKIPNLNSHNFESVILSKLQALQNNEFRIHDKTIIQDRHILNFLGKLKK